MAERPINEKNIRSVKNLDKARESILNSLLATISIMIIVSLAAFLYRIIDSSNRRSFDKLFVRSQQYFKKTDNGITANK